MTLRKGKRAAMNNTSYRIDVIGQTWQGFQGSYSKPFNQTLTSQPFSPDLLLAHFGDFQSIEDFRVTKIEYGFDRKGNKSVSTHTEEIVRDWRNADHAQAFEEMNS